jgi:hypothetical protein
MAAALQRQHVQASTCILSTDLVVIVRVLQEEIHACELPPCETMALSNISLITDGWSTGLCSGVNDSWLHY